MKKFRIIYIFSVIAVWLCFLLFLFKFVIADYYAIKGDTFLENGDYKSALSYFDKAILLNPNQPNFYIKRATAYGFVAMFSDDKNQDFFKNLAIIDLIKGLKINNNNTKYIRESFFVYSLLALKQQPTSPYYLIAKKTFAHYKDFYRSDLGVLVDIAVYEKRLGLKDDLQITLSQIKKLRPDLLDWYQDLK